MDSCRSMVALLDEDKSGTHFSGEEVAKFALNEKFTNLDILGKLGLDEFTHLWKRIRRWCDVFKKHDADGSNNMSANELRSAFGEAGLSVNRHILRCLVLRYGSIISKTSETHVERSLSFDDFIHCCIKLKISIETWNQQAAAASQQTKYGFGGYGTRTRSGPDVSFTLDEVIMTSRFRTVLTIASSFVLSQWVEKIMYS